MMRLYSWSTVVGLFISLAVSANPVSADTITFPFSINVASTSSDFEWLFGRPVRQGSTLSGRVVIDSPPSADTTPDQSQGNYAFETGQFVFDVPPGATFTRGPSDRLTASTADGHFVSRFNRVADVFAIELSGPFQSLQVAWTDFTARALTGDAFPASAGLLSDFQFTTFQLVSRGDVLFGTSDAPVPEPSTLVLTLLAGAGAATRVMRSRARGRERRTATHS
jgi:hypothetical protein